MGACVYIRERGERVEDAQSVNRSMHAHTPRPHTSSSCAAHHPPLFSYPFPPAPGKIDKTAQGACKLGELGATAAQPSHHSTSLYLPLHLVSIFPPLLPPSATRKLTLARNLSLSACLPCLLFILSCLVLSCAVPHALLLSCFAYHLPPTHSPTLLRYSE